jgi:N,N-dimethylformamidase beta subunit-like, C-terminal
MSRLLAVLLAPLVVASALLGAVNASPDRTAQPRPNPITEENALAGTGPDAWLPPSVPPTRIQGYASEISVLPGEDAHLHVSTAEGDRYRVELYRLGWYGGAGARLLSCVPSCGGDKSGRQFGSGHEDPVSGVVRAGWPVTDVVSVPAGSVSGYYYALLRLTAAGDETGARGYVPFIVRAPATRRSQILVQVPVNTWQAYNPWGGKSLYPFNSTGLSPAVRVSFDRPLAFTSQGPFDAEYNLVRFLEREGYDVSYQTDVDTDLRPESLLDHRLVVVAGHDEYWSKRMRDAFDGARALGTNLAFTGSNAAYWQIRYEDSGRTIVGYKEAAPDPEPDPSRRTIRFRDLSPPRPECELMGVMFHRIAEHIAGARDYMVTDAATSDPWFAGTGFRPGDTVLDVVGSEWDALPEAPVPAECVKPGLTTLFHYEGEPANADAVRFTTPSGARVFAGGAQQLSWSLDPFNTGRFGRTLPADARLQQLVRNAFADLARPAAPRALETRVKLRTVTLRTRRQSDPRVRSYRIVRHRGPGVFRLEDPGVAQVCRTDRLTCTNRRVLRGTYRYAVIAEDEWGASVATYSKKVVVRKPRA